MLLAAEGLDFAHALQVVHQKGVHGTGGLALFPVTLMGSQRVPHRAKGEQGYRNHRHTSQDWVGGKQDGQHSENADYRDRALLGAVDQQSLNRVHILDDAGHEIARSAFVIVARRQALQAGVYLAAHVEHHVLLEVIVHLNPDAVEKVA